MKMANTLTLIALSMLVTGCGSKWVKLDNSAAESSQIKAAKAKCQVEEKLYKLSYQEIANKAAVNSVSGEAAKEDLRKGFETKEQKVYEEIEECMRVEGLKSKS